MYVYVCEGSPSTLTPFEPPLTLCQHIFSVAHFVQLISSTSLLVALLGSNPSQTMDAPAVDVTAVLKAIPTSSSTMTESEATAAHHELINDARHVVEESIIQMRTTEVRLLSICNRLKQMHDMGYDIKTTASLVGSTLFVSKDAWLKCWEGQDLRIHQLLEESFKKANLATGSSSSGAETRPEPPGPPPGPGPSNPVEVLRPVNPTNTIKQNPAIPASLSAGLPLQRVAANTCGVHPSRMVQWLCKTPFHQPGTGVDHYPQARIVNKGVCICHEDPRNPNCTKHLWSPRRSVLLVETPRILHQIDVGGAFHGVQSGQRVACDEFGHHREECPAIKEYIAKFQSNYECTHCGAINHHLSDKCVHHPPNVYGGKMISYATGDKPFQ